MTSPDRSPEPARNPLNLAIDQLRSLVQVDRQAHWQPIATPALEPPVDPIHGKDWDCDADQLESGQRGARGLSPLAVDQASPLAVDQASPLAVDQASPLAVDQASSLAVDQPEIKINQDDRGWWLWPAGRHVVWFCQTIVLPECLAELPYPIAGLTVRLALTWWAEAAEVWLNGRRVQVGDLFDSSYRLLLSPSAQPGDVFSIALRLVSPGHDRGGLARALLLVESPDLVNEPDPGTIATELDGLATWIKQVRSARPLVDQPIDQPDHQTVDPDQEAMPDVAALEAAVGALAWPALERGDRSAFDASLKEVRQILIAAGWSDFLKARSIQLVGHAHLDLAWLWPLAETWQAAERTFRSVLALQKDNPDLTFCHSSPGLFAWFEEHQPDFFRELQTAIGSETWELAAGMWIEPDLNAVAGESIARQILWGQTYGRDRLGVTQAERRSIVWLPDTFGFCWQLPQFLRLGGITTFATQKLTWNDTSQFPHGVFAWQSPDGSEVLALMLPPIGTDTDPGRMAAYGATWEAQTGERSALWLPGVGDHGGGPTRDMIDVARRWQGSPLFPRLEWTTTQAFAAGLRSRLPSPQPLSQGGRGAIESGLNRSLARWPVWRDELFLEFHRGCYTTHGDQKRSNRQTEALVYEAELWLSLAAIAGLRSITPADRADLAGAWQRLLLNQFHDILPGSAIPEAYVDANRDWAEAIRLATAVRDRSLAAWTVAIARAVPDRDESPMWIVFNSLAWERSAWVELSGISGPGRAIDLAGQPFLSQANPLGHKPYAPTKAGEPGELKDDRVLVYLPAVPAGGYQVIRWQAIDREENHEETLERCVAIEGESFWLENDRLRAEIDRKTGDLTSLFDKAQGREILAGPGNQLQAFQDQGQYWDAWNIDPAYETHPLEPAQLRSITILETGPVRATIRVVRTIGASEFHQDYRLAIGSSVLEMATRVHWQERHVFVKAAFALADEPDVATYETACGAIARPTRPETDHERAKWEVPALRWADLAKRRSTMDEAKDPHEAKAATFDPRPIAPESIAWGVSLLNDCKYGYDAKPGLLRLSLLRGPTWPDPEADLGWHEFTYGLYPHAGGWQRAATVQRSRELNQPVQVVSLSNPGKSSELDEGLSTIETADIPLDDQGRGALLSLGAPNLVLLALKPAERSIAIDPETTAGENPGTDRFVLRCYEAIGETAPIHLRLWPGGSLGDRLDLLENPLEPRLTDPEDLGQAVDRQVHPWQIATFELKFGSEY